MALAPFFAVSTGQVFSLFGSGLVQFALVRWLTEKIGSATALASSALFFAGFLNAIVNASFSAAL